jgi:glycosyltransferase involved in cell wall biosynthesis
MAPTTTLSVVVPCHDVARFLPTTFASMQQNAADDVEWLLVDDGSTDATADLLHRFAPVRGRATVLTNPTALGLAAARNMGVLAATGRYVTFLDADDWYAAGHLGRMVAAIERLGVDFVRTDHVQAKGVTRATHRAPETRRDRALDARTGIATDPARMSMVDYPYAWSAIYDLRLRDRGLLQVDPRLHTAEDRLMAWRLHLHADTYAVVGLLGVFYRRDVAGSLTAIGDERQLHFFESMDLIGAELADPRFAPYRPKFVRTYLGLIAHHEESRARLQPAVHRRFRDRAARTIGALPADLVDDAIAVGDPRRARILEALR